jgi:hypothetical protein
VLRIRHRSVITEAYEAIRRRPGIISAVLKCLRGPTKWETDKLEQVFLVPLPKLPFVVVALALIPALSQASSDENVQLSPQATEVHGVAVPMPKEIFRSLDQFRDANWRAVERPEIARWKSHGDQAQIATLLGVVIAEGFIAMEAEDSAEVKDLGRSVLTLARGLGVGEKALRRSSSIIEFAEKNEWAAARQEWDGVFSDLQSGMIELKSTQLARLVSVGGWLRGTEALSALLLQRYSPESSSLIRQPALIDYLEKQLLAMSNDRQTRSLSTKLLDGVRRIRALIKDENGPLPEETVRGVHNICKDLVPLSSRRFE